MARESTKFVVRKLRIETRTLSPFPSHLMKVGEEYW
jgi:hypothetical protein